MAHIQYLLWNWVVKATLFISLFPKSEQNRNIIGTQNGNITTFCVRLFLKPLIRLQRPVKHQTKHPKTLDRKNATLLSCWRLDIGIKDRPVFIPNHTKKLILFTTGQRLNFWVAYRWMFQNARSRDSANFRSFLSLRFSKRESVSAAETSRSQSLDSVRCSRERLSIS